MRTWSIEYSQNGWEYTGVLIIKANDVKLKLYTNEYGIEMRDLVIADGVEIWFSEDVGEIKETEK